MKRNNTVKLLALVCLMCFSLNAATITVAANASLSSAVKLSAAKDTIMVAAGTFTDKFLIDHPLTIIGAGKTTTIIKRADQDSTLPTITITAKNVTIKNMTVFGHDAKKLADTTDTLHSYPTSDAILVSGAESTSIVSCIVNGGYGLYGRDLAAAMGGKAVKIQKSKYVFIKNDSLKGGFSDQTCRLRDTIISIEDGGSGLPTAIFLTGIAGAAIFVDSSSFVSVDSCIIEGGDGTGFSWLGSNGKGSPGIETHYGKGVIALNSLIRGGARIYMFQDTCEAFYGYDSSWIDTSNDSIVSTLSQGVRVDETSFFGPPAGVLFYHNCIIDKNNAFSLRRGNDQSLTLACLLTKESFVAIDLLNAKGQAVKKFRTEHASPGLRHYTLDLKMMNGSNAVYFLKVATKDTRRCFRVVSLR